MTWIRLELTLINLAKMGDIYVTECAEIGEYAVCGYGKGEVPLVKGLTAEQAKMVLAAISCGLQSGGVVDLRQFEQDDEEPENE